MTPPKSRHYCRIFILLISLVLTLACSSGYKEYEGDDFTLRVPAGYDTRVYDPPLVDNATGAELVLFSNVGHYPYFAIYRHPIPPGSDLEEVLMVYMAKYSERASHYQFLSQNTTSVNGRPAIEYMYCEFHGEPYIQVREIWMENKGHAYSLLCAHTGDASSCASIPVSEQCVKLVEGFEFK